MYLKVHGNDEVQQLVLFIIKSAATWASKSNMQLAKKGQHRSKAESLSRESPELIGNSGLVVW